MPAGPASLRRPPSLDEIDLKVGTVIEASAGTGKTFLLEHLVLELILTGRARIDEILVVTFTERATAELLTRIRETIDRALTTDEASTDSGWLLDDQSRARLAEARSQFDVAPVSTIHGFCQRVLTEEPFSTERLLRQHRSDGRQLFSQAFRDCVRRCFSIDPRFQPFLEAELASGGSVDGLEQKLFSAYQARGSWATVYDEGTLDGVLNVLARLDFAQPEFASVLALFKAGKQRNTFRGYVDDCTELARAALAAGNRLDFLVAFDKKATGTLGKYLEMLDASTGTSPGLELMRALARALLDEVPTFSEALAQAFLPVVEDAVRKRKLSEGTFDYDDLISAVADALDGPSGTALTESIRSRYRVVLIDEAQDTEPAQWKIFRHCFLEAPGTHAVILVGDPKQAIYGFRGADVRTFLSACSDIVARGGKRVQLGENFRSTTQVVTAYNAVFDSSGPAPFFSGDVRYDRPVTAARGPRHPANQPGVTLLTLARDATTLPVGRVRAFLRAGIVQSIQRLEEETPSFDLSRVMVLTRSNQESREVAESLRAAGIPNALYKPDYLFQSPEAEHVRALFAAIADPTSRTARFQAWLTPFFGVPLEELARNPTPTIDHPAIRRLHEWNRLAESRDYDRLWTRILADSGIVRRLRFSPFGQRRLANYRQIAEILLGALARAPKSADEIVAWLSSVRANTRRLETDNLSEPGTQKVETEARAVQILTIHKAKGLEADFVFVYGALTGLGGGRWGNAKVFYQGQQRALVLGQPRRSSRVDAIRRESEEDDQRLLYVALTRAREHLFLPYLSRTPSGEDDAKPMTDEDKLRKLSGPYRLVNQRLEQLAADHATFSTHFRIFVCPLPTDAQSGIDAAATEHGEPPWMPPPLSRSAPSQVPIDVAARTGFMMTSYSRLKDVHVSRDANDGAVPLDAEDVFEFAAHAGLDPGLGEFGDIDVEGAVASSTDPTPPPPGVLPGGAESGLFLHALLEKAPLDGLADGPTWRERADVRELLQSELRRWDRDPAHGDASLAMVRRALTTSIPLPSGAILPGIGHLRRLRREVPFVFPIPTSSSSDRERGFVRGVLDAMFEFEGRLYFADWKSDVLPSYGSEALGKYVETNFRLQIRLYVLAIVRMLGVRTESDFHARFGGLIYVFLRGLADGDSTALHLELPTWDRVNRWNRELPNLLPQSPPRYA